MNINTVTVISLSPTGGSKNYAEEIASKISSQYNCFGYYKSESEINEPSMYYIK